MRYCICGKAIARRKGKGGREREYCSDACRQRACRLRNAVKRRNEKLIREMDERAYWELRQELDAISYPPRAWLTELWLKDQQIEQLKKTIAFQDETIDYLKKSKSDAWLIHQLEEKDAEIARLNVLLEYHTKKHRLHDT